MKDITYRCDLCGERKQPAEVVGIYHISSAIEPRIPHVCEKHICRKCLSALSAAMSKLCAFPEPT